MTGVAKLVLGIDGGGSKTSAWLGSLSSGRAATPALCVLGKATGGPSNVRALGFDAALANVKGVIAEAFISAGATPVSVAQACISLAGAGRAEEQARIVQWAQRQLIADDVRVVGDAEVVLAAANPPENWAQPLVGVSLIAGTGSMAWGQNAAREQARCGGWGYLFSDEGSAYDIGRKALQLVSMSADGRISADNLRRGLLEHLNLESPEQLIAWCYGSQDARQRIASVAQFVFSIASADDLAAEILGDSAKSLASLVNAVVPKLGFQTEQYLLACAGSVLVKQPAFLTAVVSELRSRGISPARTSLVPDPVLGALRIAACEAGAR